MLQSFQVNIVISYIVALLFFASIKWYIHESIVYEYKQETSVK